MTVEEDGKQYGLITKTIAKILQLIHPKLNKLYIKNTGPLNYILVCGVIGISINIAVNHFVFNLINQLAISNGIAVIVAGASNYTFTVGPLGYLFDYPSWKREDLEVG